MLTALAAPATAQDSDWSLEEAVAVCSTCHGEDGIGEDAEIPMIWGQEFYYIYVQLRDYQAGRRANDIMSVIASELTKDQMKALAQHFSERDWPNIAYRAEDHDIATARKAAVAGLCTQCHLSGYKGNSRVPRLAGQKPEYLKRTMLEFKNKVRLNSPAKGSLLGAYEDSDIEALSRYLAGL